MARTSFVPTAEQRSFVEVMTSAGIPQDEICRVVINYQTGKPIVKHTLEKSFRDEINAGQITVKGHVARFIVASILGRNGGIKDERARATLAIFYAKTRMGWSETVKLEHKGINVHLDGADAKL